MIDASEFARVFPDAHEHQDSSLHSSENRDKKPFEQSALQAEVQLLRETVADLRADKAKLNERLDHADQERTRLLKVVEAQNEQMRLLADQRPRPRERRGLLGWLGFHNRGRGESV